MITRVDVPYRISRREVDQQFDGVWVLLDFNEEDFTEGYGNLIAYGSEEDPHDNADFAELDAIAGAEYNGRAMLVHGYAHRGREMLHVL